ARRAGVAHEMRARDVLHDERRRFVADGQVLERGSGHGARHRTSSSKRLFRGSGAYPAPRRKVTRVSGTPSLNSVPRSKKASRSRPAAPRRTTNSARRGTTGDGRTHTSGVQLGTPAQGRELRARGRRTMRKLLDAGV